MNEAPEVFNDFYEELLVRHIEGRPLRKEEGKRKLYYSWELPGGGKCSIGDLAEEVYRILRAMDYGKTDVFPAVRIRID